MVFWHIWVPQKQSFVFFVQRHFFIMFTLQCPFCDVRWCFRYFPMALVPFQISWQFSFLSDAVMSSLSCQSMTVFESLMSDDFIISGIIFLDNAPNYLVGCVIQKRFDDIISGILFYTLKLEICFHICYHQRQKINSQINEIYIFQVLWRNIFQILLKYLSLSTLELLKCSLKFEPNH